MPEMDWIVKLALVALIGLLVGVIVLYHIWLDHRIARERAQTHAIAPGRAPRSA